MAQKQKKTVVDTSELAISNRLAAKLTLLFGLLPA